MFDAIVIQQPQGQAQQLMLLLHAEGAIPQSMVPLGTRLAEEFPQALVVSVQAPQAGTQGQGFEWFSPHAITEDSWPTRVAEAMPALLRMVQAWQERSGLPPEATALVGFSQSATMVYEASQREELLAARLVGIAGRFAQLPSAPHGHSTIHMFHGKSDLVTHYGYTISAAEQLVALGADVTAEVIPHVGHEISAEVVDRVIERLRGHLPKRLWEAGVQNNAHPLVE
jgi:phospholipase/carboxylesterase